MREVRFERSAMPLMSGGSSHPITAISFSRASSSRSPCFPARTSHNVTRSPYDCFHCGKRDKNRLKPQRFCRGVLFSRAARFSVRAGSVTKMTVFVPIGVGNGFMSGRRTIQTICSINQRSALGVASPREAVSDRVRLRTQNRQNAQRETTTTALPVLL